MLLQYVYIVQQISKLHVMQCNFRKAEEVLRGALKFLRPFTEKLPTPSGKEKSVRWRQVAPSPT